VDDLSVAIDHADKAIAYFEATTSGFVEFRVGPNPGVVANSVSGLFRWMAGLADSAAARLDAAVRLARELEHPPSIAYALHHANVVDLWRFDGASITTRSEELLSLADAHGYPIWRALALVFHGTATVMAGDAEAGLVDIERGFALYNELSTPPIFWPAVLMLRATAYGRAGQLDRALELLHESEANVRDEDPLAPFIAIGFGDLLLALPTPDRGAAEARFEQAAALSRSRGAHMVELEALTRLATLRRGGPDEADTTRRLRELYDTFTESFATPQLAAARAVLDEPA
jgi:hypothetical protein